VCQGWRQSHRSDYKIAANRKIAASRILTIAAITAI
jgi:hypothetical protein